MMQIIEDIQQGYLFIYDHKVYMKTNSFHYSEKLSDYINAVRLSDGELFALPDKILVYVYDYVCNDLNKAEFDYLRTDCLRKEVIK